MLLKVYQAFVCDRKSYGQNIAFKKLMVLNNVMTKSCPRNYSSRDFRSPFDVRNYILDAIIFTANCIIVDISIFFSVCAYVFCSKQSDIDKRRCGASRCSTPHFVSWLVVLIAPRSPTSCHLWASPFAPFNWISILCHFYIRLVGPGVRWGSYSV